MQALQLAKSRKQMLNSLVYIVSKEVRFLGRDTKTRCENADSRRCAEAHYYFA